MYLVILPTMFDASTCLCICLILVYKPNKNIALTDY